MPKQGVTSAIGLGDQNAVLTLCLGKCPPLPEYQQLEQVRPLQPGELQSLVAQCSNDWRKIVNLLAKCIWQWQETGFSRWQDYRDQRLLQAGSSVALWFTDPVLSAPDHGWTLIAGHGYADRMQLPLEWLDQNFARVPGQPWLVTPYFDYRQLSNAKVEQLVEYLNQ